MKTRTAASVAALAGLAAAAAAIAVPAPQTSPDSVRSALLQALDDEYLAAATYQAVLDKHGDVRPFSNIIQAERHHAEMVKAELTARGWPIPANRHAGKITAPATLLEACQVGVKAEVDNIALYDRLLPTVADAGAKAVLEKLQWASRANHLPAFERCVARGGMPGGGGGGGHGGGGGGWRGGQ